MTSARDPLDLAGLDPGNISKTIDDKKGGKSKVPTELEVKKEERLASKESRMAKGLSNPIPPAGKGGQMAPEAGPPPEVYDKSYLLDRLGAYRERFPHLKKRNNVTAKSGVEDILDELHTTVKFNWDQSKTAAWAALCCTALWSASSRSLVTCGTQWVCGSLASVRSPRTT